MYVQGMIATLEKRKYGIPSVDILATFPKTTVKMTICTSGCNIAQENPSMVWAYRTLISRQTIKKNRSRYSLSSLKSINCQPDLGLIFLTGILTTSELLFILLTFPSEGSRFRVPQLNSLRSLSSINLTGQAVFKGSEFSSAAG